MTEAPQERAPEPIAASDDALLQIPGIDRDRQEWLASLEIHTVADLAAASADRLEWQLTAIGCTIPLEEIEGWIEAAKAQGSAPAQGDGEEPTAADSTSTSAAEPLSQEDTEASSPTVDPSPSDAPDPAPEDEEHSVPSSAFEEAAIAEEASSQPTDSAAASEPKTEAPWQAVVIFTVSFQQRRHSDSAERQLEVHHAETGAIARWSGWAEGESEALQRWMLERVPQQTDAAPMPDRTVETVRVEISQLRLWQPPHSELPAIAAPRHPTIPDVLRCHTPFALELVFRLQGTEAADIAWGNVTYAAQVYGRHQPSGATVLLSDSQAQPLGEVRSVYAVSLPETTLQEPGIYALKALVTLRGIAAMPGYLEVPSLQAV